MKLYFAGSIRAGRHDAKLYADIIGSMVAMGHDVLTEHVGLKDLNSMGEAGRTEQFIYKRDMAWLKDCEAVVAEVTTPSLGVGYEIAKAEEWNKPVLCLYRPSEGKSLSAMIAGSPHITNAEYTTLEEAKSLIESFLSNQN